MKVGFIGIGSMGSMLARALLRTGIFRPESFWLSNRSPERLREFSAEWPGIHAADNRETARNADMLFVCVHTAEMLRVVEEVSPVLRPEQLLVVIANAIPLAKLQERGPCHVAKVVPSILQEVGGGVALVMVPDGFPAEWREKLTAVLGAISEPIFIAEELGRASSDLTSAGPAFLAYVLAAMAEAASATQPALDKEHAWKLMLDTASGTLELLQSIAPDELIERVATPGGMTAAGLEVLRATLPDMWQTIFDRMKAREDAAKARLGL